MRVLSGWVPRGDAGTYAVLAHMRKVAREGALDPLVRHMAVRIVENVPGQDRRAQADAIRDWLIETTRFLPDPTNAELLHTPRRILEILQAGTPTVRIDCDDVAVLGAAVAGAIGLRARFVVVGFHAPDAPFRHVWTEIRPPNRARWIDLDITRQSQELPGWQLISRAKTVEVF